MRIAYRRLLAGALLSMGLIGMSLAPRVSAQDATPAGGDCAVTTSDENVALVLSFLDATQTVDDDADTSDEQATMDQALADDVAYDVDGMTNAPGNDDEIAYFLSNAAAFADFSYTIDNTIANDDMVAVSFTFHVAEQSIPGATAGATADANAVFIARIACGQIAEFTEVVDTMSLLTQLGLMPSMMATPAA
jgi:predicted ester cyclase